jgi:hypothetical protein
MMRKKLYEESSALSMKEIEAQGAKQQEYIAAQEAATARNTALRLSLEAEEAQRVWDRKKAFESAARLAEVAANEERIKGNPEKAAQYDGIALQNRAMAGVAVTKRARGEAPTPEEEAAGQAEMGPAAMAAITTSGNTRLNTADQIKSAEKLQGMRDITVGKEIAGRKEVALIRGPSGGAAGKVNPSDKKQYDSLVTLYYKIGEDRDPETKFSREEYDFMGDVIRQYGENLTENKEFTAAERKYLTDLLMESNKKAPAEGRRQARETSRAANRNILGLKPPAPATPGPAVPGAVLSPGVNAPGGPAAAVAPPAATQEGPIPMKSAIFKDGKWYLFVGLDKNGKKMYAPLEGDPKEIAKMFGKGDGK